MCSFFGVSRSGYYYENLLDRNFHADKPNAKWVTDFRISITSEGILYLSMIRDLYDNSIVAYKTPLCLKLNIFLPRVFFVLSAQSGAVPFILPLTSRFVSAILIIKLSII